MNIKFNLKNYKENFIIGCIFLLLAEICLAHLFPIFSYVDELLSLIILISYVVTHFNSKISKRDIAFWLLILIFEILGLMFNFIYQIQNNVNAIILDAFSVIKVFVVAIAAMSFVRDVNGKYIIHILGKLFSIVVVILFAFAIINLFFDCGFRDEYRYGIPCFKFVCINAGQFSYCSYYFISILTAYYFLCGKKNLWCLVIALLLACSTLRTRTIIFAGIYVIFFLYFGKMKKSQPIVLILISIIAIPVFIYFSYGQIDKYFNNDNTARFRLLETSLVIFKKYFPFGTGFGTYGTASAASYYSNLYYIYGLDKVWGLYPSNPDFASDNFWPSIFAQFGLLGTAIVLCIILIILKTYIERADNNYKKICCYFIFVVLLSSSLVTASFYHYSSIGLFLILSTLINVKEVSRYENRNSCRYAQEIQ